MPTGLSSPYLGLSLVCKGEKLGNLRIRYFLAQTIGAIAQTMGESLTENLQIFEVDLPVTDDGKLVFLHHLDWVHTQIQMEKQAL